jgi:glutathione synthase/RimK-type ligase-like ATP-grasp enzyme
LVAEGIPVSFGGLMPKPGGWVPCAQAPRIVYDRFPSWTYPQEYAELTQGLQVPISNPAHIQALCRDKLATQAALESAGVPMPAVSAQPSQDLLREWGGGFLKPQFGGLGRGVVFLRPGDPIPIHLPGATGVLEPAILQAPIVPKQGPYTSLRALVQREGKGWICAPLVARVSQDPVSNVDRGAQALPAQDLLSARQLQRVKEVAIGAAQALADAWTCELGVDLLLDPADEVSVRVIEVNGVPKGRGAVLAQKDPGRFSAPYQAALERPLRWVWDRAR